MRSDDSIVRLGDVRSISGLVRMAVNQFRIYFKDGTGDLCDAKHCRRHGKNLYMLNRQERVRYPSDERNEFTIEECVHKIYYSYNADKSGLRYFF